MPDQDHQYRGMDVGAGQWIIYENDNPKAWVQSDYHIPLGEQ
jgi:hypothetical protein